MSAETHTEAARYAEMIELSWKHRDEANALLTRIKDRRTRELARHGYIAALDGGIDLGLRNYDQVGAVTEALFDSRRSVA